MKVRVVTHVAVAVAVMNDEGEQQALFCQIVQPRSNQNYRVVCLLPELKRYTAVVLAWERCSTLIIFLQHRLFSFAALVNLLGFADYSKRTRFILCWNQF